jgi:hypothetical protein
MCLCAFDSLGIRFRQKWLRPRPPLQSFSYAKKSEDSLTHVIGVRGQWEDPEANIVAVRFESLDKGVGSFTDVHVYMPEIQPTIIGYVTIPVEYEQLVRLERPIILSGCFPPGSPEFRGQVFCCLYCRCRCSTALTNSCLFFS